jgi:hypothetical protein
MPYSASAQILGISERRLIFSIYCCLCPCYFGWWRSQYLW